MSPESEPFADVLRALHERAKELNCLYRVEEILASPDRPLLELLQAVVLALPPGWQYPGQCEARVHVGEIEAATPGWQDSPWVQSAEVLVRGELAGRVSVAYLEPFPESDEGPFLKEERRLIDTVADRLGQTLLHRELRPFFGEPAPTQAGSDRAHDWRTLVELLSHTDRALYQKLCRKLLNLLARNGIDEAQQLLRQMVGPQAVEAADDNRPARRAPGQAQPADSLRVFEIAAAHLAERELLAQVQLWIKEDRLNFLVQAVESPDTALGDIRSALERYSHTGLDARELSPATQTGLKVSLVRRVLSDQHTFIEACRPHLEVEDFAELLSHTVLPRNSHGRLGGKSSGLVLAGRIVRRAAAQEPLLAGIRTPRTWYLPSDGILQFLAANDLDDAYNFRYMDIRQIRQEYPHLLEVFKGSRFPPELESGLSQALDDLGERPLIVRSSSLLEDRVGSAFSGKYKSLFLANQGSKAERLTALLEAIAEVYASVFGPDPIQYRAERGLLEYNEEMGIMVQEVVGRRMGRYFLPAFAGVAFSHNELRWSPRIRRDDGLLRLVPGLGTRAVDRTADDYPILAAPGQPGLRVNATPEDVVRYSPHYVDVIDLETHAFETVPRQVFLETAGADFPGLEQLLSLRHEDFLRQPGPLDLDFGKQELLFTFEGVLASRDFLPRMRALLSVLRRALGTPVDIEFASDGEHLYLLQCRPQSHAQGETPAALPRDVRPERVLFSAHRYVTSGAVPDITHVVYVDPEGYRLLPDPGTLREVGRGVGALNKLLPKRQFILMGPGRWGSRGDLRLGVSVGYADINNAAVLVEIARKRGNYVPDLSFGTHFFQDLVEASIRYLPLYPDDPGVSFNQAFFLDSENLLPLLLPEYARLAPVLRVIDVPRSSGGLLLQVLMNGDAGQALGLLAAASNAGVAGATESAASPRTPPADEHWRWRLRMAEKLAAQLDGERFGVRALYVFGSTKNATATEGSDIDLLVHLAVGPGPSPALRAWFEGWSLCLAEANFLRTGFASEALLDVRYLTDADIARQAPFAAKIGAVTDAAWPLPLLRAAEGRSQ